MLYVVKKLKIDIIFLLSFYVILPTIIGYSQNDEKSATNLNIDLLQETTHPKIELSPVVSPDNQWLAYVSSRSGNFDIYLHSLTDGSTIQITRHRADDMFPCWAHDGKSLAFVSQRADAAGDIWIVRFKQRKGKLFVQQAPQRLTKRLGFDGYPSFSPNGEFLAFVSNRTGKDNIWLVQLETGRLLQLTFRGGTHPSWSPSGDFMAFTSFRKNSKGNGDIYIIEIPNTLRDLTTHRWPNKENRHSIEKVTVGPSLEGFPCWSPDGESLVFVRHDLDSNGDGLLTPEDNATIWTAKIKPYRGGRRFKPDSLKSHLGRSFNLRMVDSAMPLTSGGQREFQPSWGKNGRIYFSSNRGGNLDVWSLPAEGYLQRALTAKEQFETANNHFPLPSRMRREILGPMFLEWDSKTLSFSDSVALLDRALAFQRVLDFHGLNSRYAAKAFYEIGVCQRLLGDSTGAHLRFSLVATEYKDRETSAFAQMAKLGLSGARVESDSARLQRLAKGLEDILAQFSDVSKPSALASIAMGDLFLNAGQDTKAFEAYGKVEQRYGNERAACAESQIRMGDLFKNYAEEEDVVRAYLNVVQNYPDQRQQMELAKVRILDLLSREAMDDQERIERFREIAGQYTGFPRLAATAQMRIGNILSSQGDNNAALREFQNIVDLFPTLVDEKVEAQLAMAQSYMKFGESLKAFGIYEGIIKQHQSSRPDLAEKAKADLLEALLVSGQYLTQTRDYDLARARFRRAREMFPNSIEAHRGYIECSYYLRNISFAITEYEKKISQNPDDNVLLYSLALCYSYMSTERVQLYGESDGLDAELLKKSNSILASALAKDYGMVHTYLTMSYNYEMLEKHDAFKRAKPQKFLWRFISTVSAPVVSLIHTITFYQEPQSLRYYERAISALTTGITLNDETKNPLLEANMAMNLASNYYNLQEFGFAKAYEYYHYKLSLDTAFVNSLQKALTYERMGHCALVVEDFKRGPRYLRYAIELSKELGDENRVLLNTKRLALLYELGDDHLSAIQYYRSAAVLEEQKGLYSELARSFRSIAYNYWKLGENEDALKAASQAEALLSSGKVKEISAKPSRIKLGFLGLFVPIPFVDFNKMGMGSGSSGGFTTDEERALVHTIMGFNYSEKKDYPNAVNYFEKKLSIYQKLGDKRAEAAFLNNIAHFYYLQGNYKSAWQYFENSLQICKKEKFEGGILTNSLNLGRIAVTISIREEVPSRKVSGSNKKRGETPPGGSAHYRIKAAEYLGDALSLFDSPDIVFTRERIQILVDLAHLSLLEGTDLSARSPLSQQIIETITGFEERLYARTYLTEALRLAPLSGYSLEESAICMSLGSLFLSIHEPEPAMNYLRQSRKIALRDGHYQILWRVNQYLGDLVASLDRNAKRALRSQRDAFEYYAEAIEILENQAPDKAGGGSMPSIRQAHQQLYRKAIAYLANKGDIIGALDLAERMRANLYLDLLANEKIELKKERHKIYYSAAKDIQQQMGEVEANLRRTKSQRSVPKARIAAIQTELSELRKEYEQVLIKIKREDPELESFVHVSPINYRQVQNILRPGTAMLYFILGQDSSFVWLLDHTSVNMFVLPLGENEIREIAEHYYDSMTNNRKPPADSASATLSSILSPLDPLLENIQDLIIIPDKSLYFIPYMPLLIARFGSSSSLPSVVISSSMSGYFYAHEKKKISGVSAFCGGARQVQDMLTEIGFDLVDESKSNRNNSEPAYLKHIANCDIVHLHTKVEWNQIDPVRSRIGFSTARSAPVVFAPVNFYSQNMSTRLLFLSSDLPLEPKLSPEVLLAWERAFVYAGVPSLMISLWPAHGPEHDEFLKQFYTNLLTMPEADALSTAQEVMRDRGVPPIYWAGYQLVGFGGMSQDEERDFAEQGFVGKVRLGNSYYQSGEWADAIRHFEAAYNMAKMRNDEESCERLSILIIQSAVNGTIFDKAIEYQNYLIQTAQEKGKLGGVANGYNNLAFFYTQSRNYEQGIQYKHKYLELAEKYNLRAEEAKSLHDIGLIYEGGGQYTRAIEFLEKSLNLYENLQGTLGIATTLRDIGRIYFTRFDNYIAALEHQRRALTLFENLGLDNNYVDALQNMGLTYDKLSNYNQALSYQNKALESAKSIVDAKQEGLSLHYIAAIHWKIGDFQKALQYENQAMELFNKIGNDTLNVLGLSLKGLIEQSLGQDSKALDSELRALELATLLQDKANQATIGKNIGIIHRAAGRHDLALTNFYKAAGLDSAIGYKRGLAYDHLNIGSALISLKDFVKGRQALNKALELSRNIGDKRSEAKSLLLLGEIDFKQNHPDSAIRRLQESVQIASAMFSSDIEWRAHFCLAQVLVSQDLLDSAVVTYHNAIHIIEEMRARIKIDEYKSGFIDDKLDVYGELVLLLLKMDRDEDAFNVVERAKSRSFLDLLSNRQIAFTGEMSDELMKEKQAIQSELAELQAEASALQSEHAKLNAIQQKRLQDLDLQIEKTKTRYEQHLITIREANPELAEIVSVDPWPLSKLQSILPDSVSLIEYFNAKDEFVILSITKNNIYTAIVDADLDTLGRLIWDFRDAISRQLSIEKQANELYELLLNPIIGKLSGIRHLVIVPHGKLHYLPFNALYNRKGESLLDKYSTSLSPSATVLGFCLEKGEHWLSTAPSNRSVVALGNPDLGDRDLDLPFAEREIRSVSREFPHMHYYVGERATETRARGESSEASTILLSCHGEYDSDNPLFSSLLLSQDEMNDGRLEAHEIFGLDLDAYLVAMSACETGLGAIRGGDEIIGLTRSFMFAGASSLMSSLWKVDDLATAITIKRFFRNLSQGYSRAEALRLAQLHVREKHKSHPAFWAAFSISGDFR